MKALRIIILGIILFIPFLSAKAQEENEMQLSTMFNNNEELEALALYPDNIREGILELCLYPELIVKIGVIQTKTQSAFQDIIQFEPEDVQKNYWELLRYPGLMDQLVSGGQKNKKEIKEITSSYPDEIYPIALEYGTKNYNKLAEINTIDQEANKTLTALLSNYPNDTKQKVELLLKFPEVLHIMVENIDVAILVGEEYRKNPDAVIAQAEELKLEVALKHQKDIEDWKKGLEEDPLALQEFEEASKSFRQEEETFENYDPLYPNALTPEEEEKQPKEETNNVYVEYNYYPYPYWYGYPVWFPNVYWYRYPYWYHWGFYYGSEESIVILGLPSYYYFYWYFNYPTHYYRYPYLSDYIIRYYRAKGGSRQSRNSLTRSVDYWRGSSRSRILNSILEEKDDRLRRQKLREYGRFEETYRRKVERRPVETGSREQYLSRNSNRYQYLSGKTKVVKPSNETRRITRPQPTIRTSVPFRSLNLNRARETHQRTWMRSNSIRPRTSIPTSRRRKPSNSKRDDN